MQPRDLVDGEFEIGLDCCEIDLLRIGPRWSQFRTQIAADSPLEQAGFELPVPPRLPCRVRGETFPARTTRRSGQ